MVLKLSDNTYTTCSLVKSPPNIEQDMLTILAPMAVPKAQFMNSFGFKKSATFLVVLTVLFGSVLGAVQLD